jgi:hypothetical protein
MSDDGVKILCLDADDDEPAPVASSKKLACSFCGKPVWLAQSTIDDVTENHGGMDGVQLSCFGCFRIADNDVLVPLSQRQIKEAVESIRAKEEKSRHTGS